MRTRWLIAPLTVILSACAIRSPADRKAQGVPEQALLLGSTNGVISLDPATGSLLAEGTGIPTLGDWSKVFTTSISGANTILEARDAATGAVGARVSVPGELSVRVASQDGSQVALMKPLPAGGSPWIPEPRVATAIVVADSTGSREPMRFELNGNFEPEAFSTDGRKLYMVSYVPPNAPVAYRVTQLDLETGKVSPVSAGKGVVETMSGTRLDQLAPSDGRFLFTLYTTQPAEYAEVRAAHGHPVAFVHTLHLDEGWAHCIGLPEELWGGDPSDEAMAVSPDGRLLYVVDSARDVVAVVSVDLDTWGEMRTETVDFGPTGPGETQATVGPDGSLFVATGSRVVKVDTTTFEHVAEWRTKDSVLAIGFGGDELYFSEPGVVEIVDPSTDRGVRSIASPDLKDVAYVGLLDL